MTKHCVRCGRQLLSTQEELAAGVSPRVVLKGTDEWDWDRLGKIVCGPCLTPQENEMLDRLAAAELNN